MLSVSRYGQKGDEIDTAAIREPQIRRADIAALNPAVVSARYPRKRCHGSRSRCPYASRSKENCRLAKALRGTEPAPQVRSIPLGAFDADLLHQSCRQKSAGRQAQDAATRQAGTAPAIRACVSATRFRVRSAARLRLKVAEDGRYRLAPDDFLPRVNRAG